jgi:hypothetical protein
MHDAAQESLNGIEPRIARVMNLKKIAIGAAMVAMLIFGFTVYLPIDWNSLATKVPGPILRVFGEYKVICDMNVGLGESRFITITTITRSSAPEGYVAHFAHNPISNCTYA